jgi:uncharacterized protein (TIRG00374 family)
MRRKNTAADPVATADPVAEAGAVVTERGPEPRGAASVEDGQTVVEREPAAERVIVEEPTPPRRIRQPIDLVRVLLCLVGLAVVLLVAELAVRTATGLESDIGAGSSEVPSWIPNTLTVLVALALLALPIVVLLDQVLRGRIAWIADAVVAGVLAGAVAVALSWLLRNHGPVDLFHSLTVAFPTGGRSDPILTFPCAVAAYTSTAVHSDRRWVQVAVWLTFGGLAAAALLDRQAGVLAIVATLLIGRAIGLSVRYAFGIPNVHPHGAELVAALREAGLDPLQVIARPSIGGLRRYHVTSRWPPSLMGPEPADRIGDLIELDVRILDRDQQAPVFVRRLWRRVRLRRPVTRRATVTFRAAIEHDVLMAQAAAAARIRAPRLVVAALADPDAALLAYTELHGRTLDTLDRNEIDDALLRDIWQQLASARVHHLIVRGLTAEQILVDEERRAWLLDVASGEIAASRLQLRHDAALLLTTLALATSPHRAAAAAIDTLGPEAAASAVPLLQPIAMSRSTRSALRSHRTLLSELREAVLHQVPTAEFEPVRIERVRPRTVISIVGGAIAAYYLLSELAQVNLGQLVTTADPGWVSIAIAFSFISFVGATISLMGFTPIRLPIIRTFLAQVASSFVKLVTPAAVGPVALNARFIQRAGVEPALALASVGVSQVFAFGVYVVLLVMFGFLTGTSTNAESRLIPSEAVFIAAAASALVVLVALSIRPLRRVLLSRLQPTLRRVGPRLLDMLQSPVKLLLGVGGNLLVTLALMAALYASVEAFGGSISFASLAVVFLVGAAAGSAAPTPGGLGAVEAALSAGLAAAGLPGDVAVSAVLLYRVTTFWLPVIPGWLAFHVLQRAEAV